MARRPALGRGVEALMAEMGQPAAPAGAGAGPGATLPLAEIFANPKQPRRRFDAVALEELTSSVRARGVLQPILVRPAGPRRYEIVAGERRWRAAQAAGLHDIPVLVRELDDSAAFEIALIENVQRADLDPMEEVEGYRRLMTEFGHTQEALAGLTGKARSHIANLLRLLDLPDDVRGMVARRELSPGHAKALVGRRDAAELGRRIVAEGLSVRAVERLTRGADPRAPRRPQVAGSEDLAALEKTIADATGLAVRISGDTEGTVTLRYASLSQLDDLIARLVGGRF